MKPFSTIATVAASICLVTAAPAWAQTTEQKAEASAAATAGGDAFDAGKYADAAELFERAERLMHAPPHLLFAARSHAKLGQLVDAREHYLVLTRERLPATAPLAVRDSQQMGEKELAELEPRMASISVVVQAVSADNVRVTRNSAALPPELLGIPARLNPGSYSYQAFADGMESAATTVQLTEGAHETVLLTLHAVAGAAKASSAPPTTGGVTASGPFNAAPPGAGPSSGMRPLLIGSIVGLGVAAVGTGLGTYFRLKSNSTKKDADDAYSACNPLAEHCRDDQRAHIRSLDDSSESQKDSATASFVVGGLGLAAGVTLMLLDSNRSSAQGSSKVVPVVSLNYAGVAGCF